VASKSEDKRLRIVAAATSLFNRYGFKRTSVDQLAAEAGVAKPTIYAYFDDKEAIFRAVVEAVCDEMVSGAKEASARDVPIEERLAAMLSAKFTRYFELVLASPHAAELVDSHGTIGAEIVQRADRAYLALLVRVIEESELDPKRMKLSATAAAQLLMRAASGAAYDAKTPAAHRRHVAEIVRVVVAGMRGSR
jgi:AcrR family transcriptional regulator